MPIGSSHNAPVGGGLLGWLGVIVAVAALWVTAGVAASVAC